MSAKPDLSDADVRQLEEQGVSMDELQRQLEIFRNPPPFAKLVRACTVGDGIDTIDESRHANLLSHHGAAAAAGRLSKFVPASGAASRMFKTLLAELARDAPSSPAELARRASEGDASARDTLTLLERHADFAFTDEALASAAEARDVRAMLAHLLEEEGLGYASLPKGLLLFHRYPEGPRTAFEEQLHEAEAQVRDSEGRCRLHFTVSPQHRSGFESTLEKARTHFESRGTRLEVEFSVQHPSTDTVAVDAENRPFRDEEGRMLFRPGGHGALIQNLDELDSDIVLIKNIDNVVPDDAREPTNLWKKLLVGELVEIQGEVFAMLARLEEKPGEAALDEAAGLLERRFGLELSASMKSGGLEARSARLIEALDRPLRVCGVVRNEGEPGGGPFWMVDGRDMVSAQIVEGSQIDPHDEGQQAIRQAATHFNPVDLVCALKDRKGRAYDLKRFIDEGTVFISTKSQGGRELKALERPGLWNGAMAYWNTVFVEVPITTFAPVKTVFDLLRDTHLRT